MPKDDKPKAKKPERKEYVCVVPCRHKGHKYRKGMRAMFTDENLPRHNNGKIAHFELLSPANVDLPPGPVTVNNVPRP